MTKLNLALQYGGPKRLEINYVFGFRSLTIRLDGKDVGKIESRQAIKDGREFELPDGSILKLRLQRSGFSDALHILRDGRPVPGSASDPFIAIKTAYTALFFIGAANIIIGAGTAIFGIDVLKSLSSDWFSVGFGLLFIILGFAVRALSQPALIAALVIFLVDSVLLMSMVFAQGYQSGWGGMVVRIYFFFAFIEGIKAIGQLNSHSKAKRGDPRKQKQQQQGRTWTTMERSLVAVVTVMVLAIGALLLMIGIGGSQRQATVRPASGSLPTAAATAVPREAEIYYFPDREPLVLKLKPRAPQVPVNLAKDEDVADKPLFNGDLAWNEPTFANMFWSDGYPSSSTSGGSGWRSADSSGSWLYVDLGEPKTFRQLIVNSFVDAKFTNSPRTFYIMSDDLITWQIIVDEVNHANSIMRFKPRLLTLPRNVTARYVGLFANDWRGGWGGVQSFSVIPSGYDYTQETLPEI